jgi:hypothetical protein
LAIVHDGKPSWCVVGTHFSTTFRQQYWHRSRNIANSVVSTILLKLKFHSESGLATLLLYKKIEASTNNRRFDTSCIREGAPMKRRHFLPGLPGVLAFGSATIVGGITIVGCLDRPIGLVEPRHTSSIAEIVPNSGVNKIDLVLGIDNSASMADKQQILAQAVPDLVESLVNPRCVDEMGAPVANDLQPAGPEQECPVGSRREFPPVLDIHIGIISSSLGGHGGDVCPDLLQDSKCGSVSQNDYGRLVARQDECSTTNDLPTYEGKGFLAWDPQQVLVPPGEKDLGTLDGSKPGLVPKLAEMVQGVGQRGCGYESQLESIYRFLVEPNPYASISLVNGKAQMQGTDENLLAQRAAFLRPDSLLAVLMLSDENDCSMREGGAYVIAANSAKMPRARSVCAENPNDACCASCASSVPANCPADPTCFEANGQLRFLSNTEDPTNLRCFDQKRRFGFNFLYPTDRYVKGFSEKQITDREGNVVDNPLFPKADIAAGLVAPRTPELVFVAGIVGVPWQDIARNPQDLAEGFKTAKDMKDDGTWNMILGNPAMGQLPQDPLMQESTAMRTGTNPITGEPTDTSPASPLGNSINGHERNTDGRDLQYACIFDLPTPSPCNGDTTCECASSTTDNPLCDPTVPQSLVRAKAYPGLRQLNVLQGLGNRAIVASVCPQQATNREVANYGYRAAIGALVDQLKTKINGPCLPRTLNRDMEGNVNCLLIEAKNSAGMCNCDPAQARLNVSEAHLSAIDLAKERSSGNDWDCFCEIPQLVGEELHQCQNDVSDAPVTQSGDSIDGYCYIDATTEPKVGNPIHVATCPENERRRIRLVGKGQPAQGATLMVLCSGET